MPDDESAAQIVVSFQKLWNKPPLEALELVLRRTTNITDARLLLFFPEPVDMMRYVALIQPGPRGSPDNHPQNKLQRPFLSLLYMRHVRSWSLMREFILEGGLISLVRLFECENLYLRAQAVDTFMQLTSTDLHDWFAEPVLEPKVHRRLVDLVRPSSPALDDSARWLPCFYQTLRPYMKSERRDLASLRYFFVVPYCCMICCLPSRQKDAPHFAKQLLM